MDKSSINVLWILVCSFLVFLMQLGFLALETGISRSKNSVNVALKNLFDCGFSFAMFWVFGFAIAYGSPLFSGRPVNFEHFLFFSKDNWLVSFFIFQAMFSCTCSTIISGAVAERMKFMSYVFVSTFIIGIIYPVMVNLVWNGVPDGTKLGLLGKMGFLDLAGSTVIHSTGGWVSLAAVLVLGPRIGRFDKSGNEKIITGSNLPFSIMGVMALWLGWLGLNGGSVLDLKNGASLVILNTIVAGAMGMVSSFLLSKGINRDVPIPRDLIVGTLSGLVAISASANIVTPGNAMIIGFISSIFTYGLSRFLIYLKIDDTVSAIPVHLGGGIWGTLAVAIFGDLNLKSNTLGFLDQIQVQILGIFICGFWSFGISFTLLKLINRFSPIRGNRTEEIIGLNISEHRESTELFNLLYKFFKDKNINVLIINNDPQLKELVEESLHAPFYSVTYTNTKEDGINSFKKYRPDIVIIDFEIDSKGSESLIRDLREHEKELEKKHSIIISMIPEHHEKNIPTLHESGSDGCLFKHTERATFLPSVKTIFDEISSLEEEDVAS